MKEVLCFLDDLLKPNDKIVVAVSGGPDSMALLDLVLELKDKKNLNIICAHVNHNVRKESDSEANMVLQFCKQHGIVFEYMKIDNYEMGNFHSVARQKRYAFFDLLVKRYKANYLFTAHHLDDLMETILMRLVRGSTLKGYAGFKKIDDMNHYKIVRPLIEVDRETITNYLTIKNITFCEDNSNDKDCYTRNRFRHHVIPLLKKEDKNVNQKFKSFSELLFKYDTYVKKEVCKAYAKVYSDKLDISLFKQLDDLIQELVLQKVLEEVYQDNLYLINKRHLSSVLKLINSSKVNGYVDLPKGIKAYKNYGFLTFAIKSDECNYYLEIENNTMLPNGHKIVRYNRLDDKSNYVLRINSDDVSLPLYVRNKKRGDKIATKNMGGHKKISDLFTDCKIIPSMRSGWPIVVDSKGVILWVPGLKKSKYDKQITEKYDIILKYE